jgi:DNA-binding response OmpR family regulator
MAPRKFATVPVSELAERGLIPDSDPPVPLVLVVDDEPTITDTLVLILQTAGFAALAANDGEDALEIVKLTPPDLLLSDVVMPGMSGIELAEEVAKLVPDCRILLFSGQAASVDFLVSMHGGQQFKILAKPLHPRELLAELSRLLPEPYPERAPLSRFPSLSEQVQVEDREDRATGTDGN